MIPPDWIPKSPVDAISKYYGDLILPALNAPRRAALAPFGGADRFDQSLDDAVQKSIREFEDPSTGLWMGNSWRIKNPIQHVLNKSGGVQFVGQALTDPLTFMGTGLTKQMAGVPGVVGDIGNVLSKGENILQRGINEALLAPAKLPMMGLNQIPAAKMLGLTRTVVDPVTDAVSEIPAKSVGDYLFGGPSRGSQLHLFSQSIHDIAEKLMNRGHDLEADVADFANAGNIVPPYRSQQTAQQVMQGAVNHVQSRLQNLADPSHAQAITDAMHEHVADIRARAAPGQDSYERAFLSSRAADDTINAIEAGKLDTTDAIIHHMNKRYQALQDLQRGAPGILADLEPEARTRAQIVFGDLQKHMGSLSKHRENIETALQEMWNLEATRDPSLGAYRPISRTARGEDAVQEINARLSALGMDPITAQGKSTFSGQFRDAVQGRVSNSTFNDLSKTLDSWGAAGDPLTENAYRLSFDRVVRDRANNLGLNDRNAASRTLDGAMQLWKTIQLMSPNYLLQNALSGMASSQMAGVKAGDIARRLGVNGWKILRDGKLPEATEEMAAQNARLGLTTPAGASSSTGFLQDASDLRDATGKGVDVLQKVGPFRMAAGGAIGGGAAGLAAAQETPEDDTLRKTLIGAGTSALTFGSMPYMSRRFFQPLAQGTEQVLRELATVEGRTRHLSSQIPQIEDFFNHNLRGVQVSPQDRQALSDIIQQRAGHFSVKDIDGILYDAGVDPTTRRQAMDSWDSLLKHADDAGTHLSNSINFDYRNLNNAEEFARQVFPFSTWATKAFPFFAQRIAEHPIIGSTLARYEEDSSNHRKENGLSSRFAGSVEGTPEAKDIWSTLVGRDATPFYNPIRGFAPAADAARSTAYPGDPDASLYQQIKALTETMGLSEHPALGLITRAAGLQGDAASQGISVRQGAPLEALTGININRPGQLAEDALRTSLGQAKPANPVEQSALRRIDELALQKTGRPITENSPEGAPYVRAKVEKSGPIWDQALQETRRERNTRSLLGFGSQVLAPTATLTPEEERISHARAGSLLPLDISQEITGASARAPHAVANDKTVQALTQAAVVLVQRNRPDLNGQLPDDVHELLRNPTWRNMDRLRDIIFEAQAQENPDIRGYAGSGSAEKQALQHAIQLYQDVPAVMLKNSAFRNMPADRQRALLARLDSYHLYPATIQRHMTGTDPVFANLVRDLPAQRQKILDDNPMLAAYFDYRKEAGEKASLEDFFARQGH